MVFLIKSPSRRFLNYFARIVSEDEVDGIHILSLQIKWKTKFKNTTEETNSARETHSNRAFHIDGLICTDFVEVELIQKFSETVVIVCVCMMLATLMFVC